VAVTLGIPVPATAQIAGCRLKTICDYYFNPPKCRQENVCTIVPEPLASRQSLELNNLSDQQYRRILDTLRVDKQKIEQPAR
jgi:hypothetical protein